MDLGAKKALLDVILQRAADQLGDLTPHVMDAFYRRFPDAKLRFADLANGERLKLEQQMVEQALYCLMVWLDGRPQIEIIFHTTIPHHAQTLSVRPELFSELIAAVHATIAATIPAQETEETAVWNELHAGMKALIADIVAQNGLVAA
ncbi:MAG: hypothetical protein IV086_11980 [Hyphomonadaceae bacterium]|nr:MAG: hypothetical protein FD160_1916 [Caulobacteraceae bacterium]MBT9446409.1 hypothetical protein [Hyphomonadaceae bacterium]TPW06785.1 MAG: hypothetical protein FD124_1585 [Alphaproteobacteria bacterium]